MSDITDPVTNVSKETVDDILDQIMGEDGGFNDEFTELYAKYLGGSALEIADALNVDLSDRTGESRTHTRVEYEDPDLAFRPKVDMTKRITDRLPENMRDIYAAAEKQVQRPEFTSGGEVKYPSMGVGESEERVVFDADWEETARQEAAKREAIRRDNMLRGDSVYARSFVSGGRPMADGGVPRPAVNPAYIDPLSDDSLRMFEEPDTTVSEKRVRTLEETYGRASDDKPKKGLFKKKKK